MAYNGHVENGVIRLDDPVVLPEGALVRIELHDSKTPAGPDTVHTLAEQLGAVIGKAEGLPRDWSENHNVYLRGDNSR